MSPRPVFRVTLGITDAGSSVLQFTPPARELTPPQVYRELNAVIYQVPDRRSQ